MNSGRRAAAPSSGGRIVLAGTPAESHLRLVNMYTERRLAQVRVVIVALCLPLGVWLLKAEALLLVMPPAAMVLLLVVLLLYSVGYLATTPWVRYDLHRVARGVAFLDQGAVVVTILNTGGLGSPFWGVAAGVLLLYIVRFGLTRREMVVVLLLTMAAMVLAGLLVPLPYPLWILPGTGISLTVVLVMIGGRMLVRREHEAIEQAFTAEYRAIARIVNTVQHEVNNPLAIAAGNMELLRMGKSGTQDDSRLELIEQAMGRIQKAVAQLRELGEHPMTEGAGLFERFVGSPTVGGTDRGEPLHSPEKSAAAPPRNEQQE